MNDKYILFKSTEGNTFNNSIDFDKNYRLIEFKPSLMKMKLGRMLNLKDYMIHLLWYFATQGRYRIIYVYHKDEMIHYSYIIPQFFKFGFMLKNDLEIGPSYTQPHYRGNSIFPYVVKYILEKYKKNINRIYMITTLDNKSSQKGIIKAGLKIAGIVKKNIFGIYQFTSDPNEIVKSL